MNKLFIAAPALVVIALFVSFPRDIETGHLSAYAELPTTATLAYRIELGQIELGDEDVYIAVLDCSRIGDTGMLVSEDLSLSFLVFDCAGIADGGYDWMVDNDIVAEVDYYTWQSYPQLIGADAVLLYDSDESGWWGAH